jgi:hypothetical protein
MEEISAQSSRLKQFIEHTGMTVSQFGKQCGFASASTLHNVIAVGKTPSQKVLEKIINRFPQLNYDWVVLGYGEMIVKGFDNKPVSADSLQKSTQASFGTIQQSMSSHDFSLNELAKSVEKAITRVDTMSQFVIQAAKSSLEKQELLEKLFFEKVDNKILEVDQHVAQLFHIIRERDEEARDLEDKRIERLDLQRREDKQKEMKILFDQFDRLSKKTKEHLDLNAERQKTLIQEKLDEGMRRGIDQMNLEMRKNAVEQTDFAIKSLMEKFRLSNLIPGLGSAKKTSNPKLKE